jgi:hypothetical protein
MEGVEVLNVRIETGPVRSEEFRKDKTGFAIMGRNFEESTFSS